MIPLLHGIANSRKVPQAPFNLFIDRQLTPVVGPFGASDPITPGTSSNSYVFSNDPGYLYFEMSVTGDTSSFYEYGIVSATFANPTYSNNAQLVNYPTYFDNPSYGVTYSVSAPELRYYRMYASDISGNYFYSDAPGFLFQMEKIELTVTDAFIGFTPPYNYFDITVFGKLVNPVGTVSEAGFYVINSGALNDPNLYDPYWNGTSSGTVITTATQTIISNEFSHTFVSVGGLADMTFYARAFAVIGGQRYWSQLHVYII